MRLTAPKLLIMLESDSSNVRSTAPFNVRSMSLQLKKLLQDSHRVLGVRHGMSDGPFIAVDFIIISTLVRLVAEEMDGAVVDAANRLLGSNVLQTVRLIPAGGEDIEGDLTTNRISVEATTGSVTAWRDVAWPLVNCTRGLGRGKQGIERTSNQNRQTWISAPRRSPPVYDVACHIVHTQSSLHYWHCGQWVRC